ncbi:MAG TPA: type I-E CRISPR-associated protein Cas6/Cse3/CasE [Rhodanobacteraceae bacterium]
MSYFSRIQLNATHPDVQTALYAAAGASAHSEHQWLWRFFPTDRGAARDFVFRRMDPDSQHAHAIYYLVSQRQPCAPHPAWRIDTREYTPRIATGATLAFELRVNPVVTRNGHRHDIIMDAKTELAKDAGYAAWTEMPAAQQAAITAQGYAFIQQRVARWLDGTPGEPGFAARHGFALARHDDDAAPLRVDGYRRHRLAAKDKNDQQRAWFSSVDLAGALTVTDAERFNVALHRGAGHAKAYGCGLLLIRRA